MFPNVRTDAIVATQGLVSVQQCDSGVGAGAGGVWRRQAPFGPGVRVAKLRKVQVAIAYCGAA